MTEEDVVISDIEKAKIVMGKVDPVLLSAALSEMMIEADKAEEADDVARVKKAIKSVYDSIPEGKDKASIMSKAIAEFDADVVDKEIAIIKEKLAGIALETLMDAATNYVGGKGILSDPSKLGSYFTCSMFRVQGYGSICSRQIVDLTPRCGLPLWCDKRQIVDLTTKCDASLWCGRCLYDIYDTCPAPVGGIDLDPNLLEEFVIPRVIQSPQLSRAVKKMVDQMKK